MKKLIVTLAALAAMLPALAQNSLNDKAENILGKYECFEKGNESRMQVTVKSDGAYYGKMFWIKDDVDPKTGDCWKDYRNPDKSLRDRYTHDLTFITGLKYNPEKKMWEKGKIYDPNRGIKVTCTAKFADDGTLVIRGSVLGIGESITWKRIK